MDTLEEIKKQHEVLMNTQNELKQSIDYASEYIKLLEEKNKDLKQENKLLNSKLKDAEKQIDSIIEDSHNIAELQNEFEKLEEERYKLKDKLKDYDHLIKRAQRDIESAYDAIFEIDISDSNDDM